MSEVTVQAASDFLGVTQRTVINYIRAKEIEAVKVGKSWFIKKPSLDAFSQRYGIWATSEEKNKEKQKEPSETNDEPSDKFSGDKTENTHSVAKLRLFCIATEIFKDLDTESITGIPSFNEKIQQLSLQALENLGAGYYSFDPINKAILYRRSRERVGGILALLYFVSKEQAETSPLISKIESDLMPAYSALIRRMEKKREKS